LQGAFVGEKEAELLSDTCLQSIRGCLEDFPRLCLPRIFASVCFERATTSPLYALLATMMRNHAVAPACKASATLWKTLCACVFRESSLKDVVFLHCRKTFHRKNESAMSLFAAR
jgi:hypothetical protein